MKATKKVVSAAQSNQLPSNATKVAEAIKAAVESVGASAHCAEVFDSIAAKWAFVDGRKCKTDEAAKKHASDLGMTVPALKEVQAWTKEIIGQYMAKYKDVMGEERAKAGSYAFLLNIKRHSAAFIDADPTGKRATKAKGKAKAPKAKAPKAKAKAPKAAASGPDVATLVAGNPQEGRKVISLLIAALTEAAAKRKAAKAGTIRLQAALKHLRDAEHALSLDSGK